MDHSQIVSFIWGVADQLRGDYKQSEYGRVILPFLVLRRLDQVLAPVQKADDNHPGPTVPPRRDARRHVPMVCWDSSRVVQSPRE